jgi:hypothetical protein
LAIDLTLNVLFSTSLMLWQKTATLAAHHHVHPKGHFRTEEAGDMLSA